MANDVIKFIKNPSIQQTIEERLKQRSGQFTSSLLSVINNNELLAKCTPETVLQAAMTAASMDLPINQNLGFAYIIPYNNSKKITDEKGKVSWTKQWEAQFQMGVKGFIQLAQRSRQYKTISAAAVYEGQLVSNDPLRGIVFDWNVKPKAKAEPVGYAAYFELLNGFEKTLFMTMDEIKRHANRYSQSFKNKSGPWSDNFDAMAQKTVIKLLLSKFGPLSTEMQTAMESDQSVDDGQNRRYVDRDLDDVKADDDKKAAILAANTPEGETSEDDDDEPDETDGKSEVTPEKVKEVFSKPADEKPEEPKESVADKAKRKYGPKQTTLTD